MTELQANQIIELLKKIHVALVTLAGIAILVGSLWIMKG